MMFSEKMNFDRLKNIELSELKVIEDSKVVQAIELTTFNSEKVQMDSKVTFESQNIKTKVTFKQPHLISRLRLKRDRLYI